MIFGILSSVIRDHASEQFKHLETSASAVRRMNCSLSTFTLPLFTHYYLAENDAPVILDLMLL